MNKTLAKYAVYGLGQWLRGEPVMRLLRELKRTQHRSPDEIEAWRNLRLRTVLEHLRAHVPYYRGKIPEGDLSSFIENDGLASLPTVSRLEVREHFHDLCSDRLPRRLTRKLTGGSTGEHLTVLKDRLSTTYARACMYRGYSWANLDIGDKQVRFWGVSLSAALRRRYQVIDFFMNRIRLSAFRFRPEQLETYFERIKRFKPAYFYGYTSLLYEFGLFVKRRGLDGRGLNLKAIISTSEALYDVQKNLLEEVFGCRVLNEYGCSEMGPVAFECEKGKMHINVENVVLETLKDGKPTEPGEEGEIALTELNNLAMPLLRYRMGDIGVISAHGCDCGRHLPILERALGRALDFVVGANGEKLHGEVFAYVIESVQSRAQAIRQFQVVQKKPGAIDVFLVRDEMFDDSIMKGLDEQLKVLLGEDMTINYAFRDEIERLKSGKLRLVVNEMD